MTQRQIEDALASSGIEIYIRYPDRPPEGRPDRFYPEPEDLAWRSALLAATGRLKMSRQLSDSQDALRIVRQGPGATGLRIRVLTAEAAMNLQRAGFTLQVVPRIQKASAANSTAS